MSDETKAMLIGTFIGLAITVFIALLLRAHIGAWP